MQQTDQRDNKQEIAHYIAGLMDSDGHISITRYKIKKDYSYRHAIYFCNTDPKLIDVFVRFLIENKYHYYIRTRTLPKKRVLKQYEVKLVRQTDALRFLNHISPLLNGNKKEYSKLLTQFLKSRIERINSFEIKRDDKGRYLGGTKPIINDYVHNLFIQYTKLRDPQRLHAMPLPLTLQKG